jgi:hypothetical protein
MSNYFAKLTKLLGIGSEETQTRISRIWSWFMFSESHRRGRQKSSWHVMIGIDKCCNFYDTTDECEWEGGISTISPNGSFSIVWWFFLMILCEWEWYLSSSWTMNMSMKCEVQTTFRKGRKKFNNQCNEITEMLLYVVWTLYVITHIYIRKVKVSDINQKCPNNSIQKTLDKIVTYWFQDQRESCAVFVQCCVREEFLRCLDNLDTTLSKFLSSTCKWLNPDYTKV